MLVVHLLFYFFAALALLSALAVITVTNPVRSVLALAVTFFAMSGVWMILSAEFLSLILLLVYVGAVMTLFLFVVMMLNANTKVNQEGFTRYFPLGVLVIFLMLGLMGFAFHATFAGLPTPEPASADFSNLSNLAAVLYTDYAYPFELAGVLLLSAIVAALSLTHRVTKHRKRQKVSEQVQVRRSDRVRLIKMPSEKKNDLPE